MIDEIKIKIVNNHNLTDEEIFSEIVQAEGRMNIDSAKIRFHANLDPWNTVKGNKPEDGIEVIGFNKDWSEHEDETICMCFMCEDKINWIISQWCEEHGEYHTLDTREEGCPIEPPTHWKEKYKTPII